MNEIDYIIRHFDDTFRRYQGKKIALYPGEYLNEIVRLFDAEYHFHMILEPDCIQVPIGTDLVILTDCRTGKEPDYNRIRTSCEEQGVLLLDLFGLDQIELHRELKAQEYLSIPQWKELLFDYDIVTVLISGAVARYFQIKDQWLIRYRFLTIYQWLIEQGKKVFFFWDEEAQVEVLKTARIDVRDCLIKREGNDQGFLRFTQRYHGKRMIHIGVGTVRDGIIPREYGMDSRLFRYYYLHEISVAGSGNWVGIEKKHLMEEINRHDVISFDIFDTLLKRTVLRPENVFEIIEERTGIQGFTDRRRELQTVCPQFSLDEIYDCLKEQCGYDDQTIETLRETELKVEEDIILPRTALKEIYEYAKQQNKTIVLVSDMYLDAAFIQILLEKSGITGYQGLYLSYQYKKLKQDGLFEELSQCYLNMGSILHIGDDYYSDYICAQEYNIDSFYVPSVLEMAKRNGYEAIINSCNTIAEKKMLGLSISLGFDNPFEEKRDVLIANMVVAPLTLSYLLWVCGRLSEKKYDWFLLSSRDGWILTEAYNRMQRVSGGNLPPGKYFYISRHAMFLTIIDDDEQVKKLVNFQDYDNDPEKLLHRQFNVPIDQLLPYKGETAERYYQMHEAWIHALADCFRENYQEYLKREGIKDKTCAIMDLFAVGTGQVLLEKLMERSIDGYYFGIPEYVSNLVPEICFFFDHDWIDYDTEMKTEVYFTSLDPALDHIDGQGRPVFAEEIRSQATLARIRDIHEQVRHYLNRYIDNLYDAGEKVDKEFALDLCKTINYYEVENEYFDDMTGEPIGTKP